MTLLLDINVLVIIVQHHKFIYTETEKRTSMSYVVTHKSTGIKWLFEKVSERLRISYIGPVVSNFLLDKPH